MARIRTIKPEFWTDEKIVAMSAFARLLFLGLLNFVDDDGRAAYSPARLKMQILPADAADISALLGEIRREGLIAVYEVDGKEYFEVCNFAKHQKVDKRTPSKLPARPESPRIVQTEGKGKEGKEDGAVAPTSDDADLYRRGKQILGQDAGSLIARLKKSKGGSVPLTRAVIEQAATKENPHQYVGRVIAGPRQAVSSDGQPFPDGII